MNRLIFLPDRLQFLPEFLVQKTGVDSVRVYVSLRGSANSQGYAVDQVAVQHP